MAVSEEGGDDSSKVHFRDCSPFHLLHRFFSHFRTTAISSSKNLTKQTFSQALFLLSVYNGARLCSVLVMNIKYFLLKCRILKLQII